MSSRHGSDVVRRIGLTRWPWLTAVMVVVLLSMAVFQAIDPHILGELERTSAGLHGDWWRTVTALFVQDGGLFGAASNVLFLGLVGALAEQIVSRPRWLLHYFGVGLFTELVAYALQPVGGGNSIAVCGLTGAVALATWRKDPRLPRAITAPILVIWTGALVAMVPSLALWAAIAAAVATGILIRYQQAHEPPLQLAALVVAATGMLLAALGNIHGVALLAGLLLATITLSRSTGRRDSEDFRVPADPNGDSAGGAIDFRAQRGSAEAQDP